MYRKRSWKQLNMVMGIHYVQIHSGHCTYSARLWYLTNVSSNHLVEINIVCAIFGTIDVVSSLSKPPKRICKMSGNVVIWTRYTIL